MKDKQRSLSFSSKAALVRTGPILGFGIPGALVENSRTNPVSASFLGVPNIILLPGAVAIRANGKPYRSASPFAQATIGAWAKGEALSSRPAVTEEGKKILFDQTARSA